MVSTTYLHAMGNPGRGRCARAATTLPPPSPSSDELAAASAARE